MFVAVDVGTSAIKAVVFDRTGSEVVVARRGAEIDRRQPSWAEQDMDRCWSLVCAAVREAAAGATDIEFVAVTAQGDGCWPVDANMVPVRPAILWNDGRARNYIEDWLTDGVIAKGYQQNGSVGFSGLANASLRWLADNEPDALARTRYVLSCGSWIYSKLTGVVRIEISDASAPFLDLQTGEYSLPLLDLYKLEGCKEKLPPVVSGASAVDKISPDAARETGLPEGTPVVLAPYDVASATLGAGACNPGDAVVVLGTTFFCGVVTNRFVIDGQPSGSTVALGIPGRFLRFFPTLAGIEVLDWAAKLLGKSGPPAVVELASAAEPGAKGLHFLPYLSPAGERAPFLEPSARGSLLNLSLVHTEADIARAVVEGLTMVVRDCLAAVPGPVTSLRLSGGGSNSDAWCQLLADVTGIEAYRVKASEVTAKGAALAGLIATGRAGVEQALTQWTDDSGHWRPDPRLTDFYARQYREFCRLRALAREGWNRVSPIREASSS